MKIRDAILAESLPLPPIPSGLVYQYVVAGNGLFIRAEDRRMEAMVPVALADNHGLELIEPYARLKVPRVPNKWLWSILQSARKRLPNEAMYQFNFDGSVDEAGQPSSVGWHCSMPAATADPAHLVFDDQAGTVIDLHSHGVASALFSTTDDGDEQGFRFYVVVGRVDQAVHGIVVPGQEYAQLSARVGVYGHHWPVPIETLFDSGGPFMELDPDAEKIPDWAVLTEEEEQALAEEDAHE